MDFHYCFGLLALSLLLLRSTADGTGSVLFLDSPAHRYFRPSDAVSETDSMSLVEVGAAVSVALGVAPPATLSAASSSKLNELLVPNPFDRPLAVFMLDVKVSEDTEVSMQSAKLWLGSSLRSKKATVRSEKAVVQLSDEDDVFMFSLNKPSSLDSHVKLTDKDLSDFASWCEGTYTADASEQFSGELNVPLASGARLNLLMSKKADREFIRNLISLTHDTRRAMDSHSDLSGSALIPAELITGSFDGIKALQEEYGTEGVAQQGLELFFASVSKIFDSLEAAYKGKIVGVILFNGAPHLGSETAPNMMFTSQRSARVLEEKESSSDIAIRIAEVLLVRTILAWLTGIILLIATLMGVYFLLYMPITKDTLLYSNIKLD